MYKKTYRGKYTIKKKNKYKGDHSSVTYRSSWERACFVWCERSANVVSWNSEEVIVDYFDKSSNKKRRYSIDLYLEMSNGKKLLVEVKPNKETKPPRKNKKNPQRYLEESMTYVTNQCKWEAASKYAKKNGLEFVVWTEKELRAMKILRI